MLEKTFAIIRSNCQTSATPMFTIKLCPQVPYPYVFSALQEGDSTTSNGNTFQMSVFITIALYKSGGVLYTSCEFHHL